MLGECIAKPPRSDMTVQCRGFQDGFQDLRLRVPIGLAGYAHVLVHKLHFLLVEQGLQTAVQKNDLHEVLLFKDSLRICLTVPRLLSFSGEGYYNT